MAVRTYQVRRNDDWERIAQSMYGNSRWTTGLMRANPGVRVLSPGITLRAPTPPQPQQPWLPQQAYMTPGAWGGRPYTAPQTWWGRAAQSFGQAVNPLNWNLGGVGDWLSQASRAYSGALGGAASTFNRMFVRGVRSFARQPVPTPLNFGQAAQQAGQFARSMQTGILPGTQLPWLPQQAFMRPEQWSGRPYTPAAATPAPSQGGGGFPPGWFPQQYIGRYFPYGNPYQQSAYLPESQFAIYGQETGGGGGGYGGFRGYRGGGGRAKKLEPGTITLVPQRGYNFGGTSPTGRTIDLRSASLGFIHWRV